MNNESRKLAEDEALYQAELERTEMEDMERDKFILIITDECKNGLDQEWLEYLTRDQVSHLVTMLYSHRHTAAQKEVEIQTIVNKVINRYAVDSVTD